MDNLDGEEFMTTPQSTPTVDDSLGRDVLSAARYHLGNRWTLLALAGLAVILGLAFGGWGWLVAAGLAPVILSTLPCLIMCAFGVCMMCRSNKTQSAASGDAADQATSSAAVGVAKMDRPTVGSSNCCHEPTADELPKRVEQLQPIDERKESDA